MIKAIVLDIDGVIIGNLPGINFPHPSPKVIKIINKIHDSGIPVCFLSGKPSFTAAENIKSVGIDNPHIADGGATIFNPVRNQIIHSTFLESSDVHHLFDCLPKNTYINIFTPKEYFLQESSKNEFTDRYEKFLKKEPVLVKNIIEVADRKDIVKINIIVFSDKEKNDITKSVNRSKGKFNFSWSSAPALLPAQAMVITEASVSKQTGVKYLADYLNVDLDNILGVGDMIHDWDFIGICGYKAAMGNASEELKAKINLKDPKQIIGGHVNEDGIIDIFKKFDLI